MSVEKRILNRCVLLAAWAADRAFIGVLPDPLRINNNGGYDWSAADLAEAMGLADEARALGGPR